MSDTRVLIIDDEDFICENLQRILKEEGYESIVSRTAKEALEIVKSTSVDLVLLDLNLPDMPGLEVLRTLKKEDPDILVVIITGYASVESAVEAIKLGAYDYSELPPPIEVVASWSILPSE